jgi:hypothetical protein
MTVKEFLLTNKIINNGELARLMYPGNQSSAHTYLSRKLSESDGRVFTDKDAKKALEALKSLGIEISSLTLG